MELLKQLKQKLGERVDRLPDHPRHSSSPFLRRQISAFPPLSTQPPTDKTLEKLTGATLKPKN